ncbi:MAG: hypothetical protein CM15mP128_5350 [Methanobacteriota archaeon]|nr:MAG: hypothetical protein CM15mP128_5350 [Euryarchaeota archaeon]
MSFGRQEVGPEADEQELMNAFGELIEKKYKSDFEMLSTCEEEIFPPSRSNGMTSVPTRSFRATLGTTSIGS